MTGEGLLDSFEKPHPVSGWAVRKYEKAAGRKAEGLFG